MGAKNEEEEEKERLKLLVLGAAHADTILKAKKGVVPGHTSPVTSDRSFGGAGYNLASILKKLGNHIGMVTAIGGDTVSGLILKNLQQQGIPTFTIVIPEQQTASYTAIHDANGNMYLAAIVNDIYDEVSVKRLEQHLSRFKKAEVIITDSSFPEEVYSLLGWVSKQGNKDVYIVLSSLETSKNVKPLLGNCTGLFGNVEEINHLAGNYDLSEKGIWKSLETLAAKGVEGVFATHRDRGVFALVEGQKIQSKAHVVDKVISAHGAGDTFAAAVIDSMRKGVKPEEAIKTGLAAAALRTQDKEINQVNMRTAMEAATAAQKVQKKMLFKIPTP